MVCSICGRRFATVRFGVCGDHSLARPRVPISSILTHMVYLSLTVLVLFSWLQKRFCPSTPDTMTNTTPDATASSSSKNGATFSTFNLTEWNWEVLCGLGKAISLHKKPVNWWGGQNATLLKFNTNRQRRHFLSYIDKCSHKVLDAVISGVVVD